MANMIEGILNITKEALSLSYKALKDLTENPNRTEILKLINKQKLTITEISKKINLSYRNTFNHITTLEKIGLVKKEKHQKELGRKVYIIPTGKTIEDLKKELEEELKKIQNYTKHKK